MEPYQTELADAKRRLSLLGRDGDDFAFAMTYRPPEPDGAGMFTVEYEVTITHAGTSRSLTETGGIGWRWVDRFEVAVNAGFFD